MVSAIVAERYPTEMPRLHAGSSGFAYASWKPVFYPQKLAAAKFLAHYATRLNAVEINYTFRRLPSAATLERWVSSTPDGFVFAVKANMRITHILKLKNAEQSTELFLKMIDPLRTSRRLGPILFQLAPTFKRDDDVLENYLKLLPSDLRYAFEFRHASWLADPVYEILGRSNVSLCLAESEKLEIPKVITADFVYSRLRKADYTKEMMAEIESQTREQLAAGRDVFAFFKHEEDPHGALYAEDLLARF
jgi:uncharacterized protein YecE (DUF72 family)